MPKLRPPNQGRSAAAVVAEPDPELEKVGGQEEDIEASGADDAVAELQKQLEDLKKSSQAEREAKEKAERERTDAIRLFRDKATEVQSLQKQNVLSELEAVSAAMAAAKAEADSA